MFKFFIHTAAFFLLLLNSQKIFAQNECGALSIDSAMYRYNIGRFDECIEGLNTCLASKTGFSFDQKTLAYDLLAKCYLAVDMLTEADSIVTKLLLLKENYETAFNDSQSFKNMVEVARSKIISSVSKLSEEARLAPATISVITHEEIFQRGYNDLIDVLKDLPGFDVSIYYGQLYANVYQRGLRTNNTEKTLLLVDGVEENDLWSNFADISQQYPLLNIKRIEVIYGPASTMYGPTAFSGVINIITKEPADYLKKKKSFGLTGGMGIGSYDTRYADINTAYRKGIFSFNLTARLYHSDRPDLSKEKFWDYDPSGYDANIPNYGFRQFLSIKEGAKEYIEENQLPFRSPFYRVTPDSGKIIITDEGIAEAVRLNKLLFTETVKDFDYKKFVNPSQASYINARLNMGDFSLGFVSWNKDEGIGTTYTDYVASVIGSKWITGHRYLYMKYNKRISEKILFSAFANYRIHSIKNGSKITTKRDYSVLGGLEIKDLQNGVKPTWLTTYYYEQSTQFRSEFKLLYNHSKHFYILSGLELRNSQLQDYFLSSVASSVPQETGSNPRQPGGNFSNVYDIGFYSQGNYRTNSGWGFTLGARLDYNQIRKSGGLGYQASPRFVVDYTKKDWLFKGIVSKGIENVSGFTKFDDVNILPNPDLKPESIYNYEVSVTKKISNQFSADIDFYYSNIKNVVSPIIVRHVLQNKNVGEFKIKGIQSNLYYTSPNKKWVASANYAYTHPKANDFDSAGNNTGKIVDVSDIAPHKINVIVNYTFLKKCNINLRANYLSKKLTGINTSVPTNKAEVFEPFVIFNSAITVQNLATGLNVQLVCNNLLNTAYYTPGIRGAGGIRYSGYVAQMKRNFYLKAVFEL